MTSTGPFQPKAFCDSAGCWEVGPGSENESETLREAAGDGGGVGAQLQKNPLRQSVVGTGLGCASMSARFPPLRREMLLPQPSLPAPSSPDGRPISRICAESQAWGRGAPLSSGAVCQTCLRSRELSRRGFAPRADYAAICNGLKTLLVGKCTKSLAGLRLEAAFVAKCGINTSASRLWFLTGSSARICCGSWHPGWEACWGLRRG